MVPPSGNAGASRRGGPRFRIGTQGWSYPAWVGPFYPPERQTEDLLGVYAEAFDTVEVNSTYYATPDGARIASWRERTPAGFRFALKLPGEITHERRLRDCRAELTTFLLRAELLEDKLGPLLIQLPPDFTRRSNEAAVRDFIGHLPADFTFAIEFRAPGWLDAGTIAFLDDWGIAPAVSVGPWRDGAEARALIDAIGGAGSLTYVRWMGAVRHRYGLGEVEVERDDDLDAWAATLREAATGDRIVWAFFNNDWQGHSPASARALQRRLGMRAVEPGELVVQRDLF
ncbi:MAG TPA: DUF72 domain-containing protein [Longimicrobiales bacterium]|nr:DUF72 domain-containing protein [Longimicrobiales bacterium]